MRIGVLASGSGTILQAILDAGIPVEVVVADRPCAALERAEAAGVPALLVERTDFGKSFDREGYSTEVVEALRKYDVELAVIAGFGTIVPEAATAFPNRILNTHPSLLPAFKGWHAVREALAAGVKVTGCTVHLVTEEVDAGPILAQETVPVLPTDTEATLHERIKEVERRLYPDTIKRFMNGEIQ
ncbi:MAG: phosphoribosylglycinamide formyltransferase 1 [Actinomycetota bacterium]|jgi:phosphoribosylglycinamide formyltransferase-1|nr:phosphoribosylglycinamide formyltransferase 1 [Actinomycetota bacterium]